MEYRQQAISISLCTALLVTAGCAANKQSVSQVVRQGDSAAMSFTCRLANGDLAVTTSTDQEVAGEPKSPLYLPRNGEKTITVSAGPRSDLPVDPLRQSLEAEVVSRLAAATVGMAVGKDVTLSLAAEKTTGLPTHEQTVKVARTRSRQKQQKLTVAEYAQLTGKAPEVGRRLVNDPLVPGTVTAVNDQEVVVAYAPVTLAGAMTPFGPATIRELADHFAITIDAAPGWLVRSGGLIGRVTAVDKDFITIDYSRQFGGENLRCNVMVKEILAAGQATEPRPTDATKSLTALAGDLAMVDYTATLEDGTMFATTSKAVADDTTRKKVAWYKERSVYGAETVTVGKPALLPGVGDAVAGMAIGEVKSITLPPEKAFGQPDPNKRQQFPLQRSLPRVVGLSAEEYVKQFGAFPVLGQEVPLTPYFPARVSAVREREVELTFLVEDGKTYSEPFGVTTVTVRGDDITTTLLPVIGALFPLPEGSGVISAVDSSTFTIDQNQPLAGKTIVIDLQLTGLVSGASLPKGNLPWQEEHDAALAAAKQAGKPALLVLYADWCSFCHKLFSESFPDPRITTLRDKFTWLKINSDQLTEYKQRYGQSGYPQIVLFRADGTIAYKQDGYLDAAALRSIMQEVL